MSADSNTITSTTSAYGPGDTGVPGNRRGDCDWCAVDAEQAAREKRGLVWVIGAFAICPCHLPLTLALVAAAAGGTAAGAALRAHPIAAGAIISAAWAIATWHGFKLMKRPNT
jgi:hypothetical protein